MDFQELWRGFQEPPDEARPRAWWHWMDGNVDPEGIRLDLEWLARIGVRGVQMFDGGMGTPLVVPEKVRHGSPEWQKVVWSETVVEGGSAVEQPLTPLPDVAGPYQDCPRWGADPSAHRFVQRWA